TPTQSEGRRRRVSRPFARARDDRRGPWGGVVGVRSGLAVHEELGVFASAASGGAVEPDDVAGAKALPLHEAAPALGEDIALAAVLVRVAEAPHLVGAVLEFRRPLLSPPAARSWSGKCFSTCCFGITSLFSLPTSLGVTVLSKRCSRAVAGEGASHARQRARWWAWRARLTRRRHACSGLARRSRCACAACGQPQTWSARRGSGARRRRRGRRPRVDGSW
uniref:Uncharacterized protein n=1 Tax=Triticum urartu TaxID=4572 RepID=A0A8R7RFQ0_TRIUA